ncbi:TPA: phosphoserine phosphatase, partial [Streptococcus pneumoniae]
NSIHLSLNVPEFISILQKNGILVGLVCGVWWIPIVGEISKIPWYCLFHCQPA